MAEQLAFDLPVRPALGRLDFLVSSSNALALAEIDRWPDWPARSLLVTGPPGSGKSHLAAVWREQTDAGVLDLDALCEEPRAGHFLIEGIDRIPGQLSLETGLFHWLNAVRAQDGTLLLTARSLASADRFVLPDLASRIGGTPAIRIEDPDDPLLQALLVKLFADRQIAPPLSLISWLMRRMERSGAAAQAIVAELDARSLATGRPIGPGLAAEVLADL